MSIQTIAYRAYAEATGGRDGRAISSDGVLDVALLALPLADPGLIEIPMYAEDFVLALPAEHPLAGRRDLTVADLRGLTASP